VHPLVQLAADLVAQPALRLDRVDVAGPEQQGVASVAQQLVQPDRVADAVLAQPRGVRRSLARCGGGAVQGAVADEGLSG
jgi:hypothetical protein